jgi:hypothetical protein
VCVATHHTQRQGEVLTSSLPKIWPAAKKNENEGGQANNFEGGLYSCGKTLLAKDMSMHVLPTAPSPGKQSMCQIPKNRIKIETNLHPILIGRGAYQRLHI